MIAQWRLFLLALRYFTRIPVPTWVILGDTDVDSAARFLPLVGAVVGAAGGAVYWLAAQFWPASVAVVLSMLATMLLTGGIHEVGFADICTWIGTPKNGPEQTGDPKGAARFASFGMLVVVLFLFTKYNSLMALCSASLAFGVPANVSLGVVMLAAHAASRALVVTALTGRAQHPARVAAAAPRLSTAQMCFALLTGFLPATLLGTPGLVGLAAAIAMRLAALPFIKQRLGAYAGDFLGATQQLSEVSFYLGAIAAWTYI
jgi:adenosylcobinamide-GDP ribazoletransferase